jgi:hypothetical protein
MLNVVAELLDRNVTMTKSFKVLVVITGLVGLAACDSGSDQIVAPDIPEAPEQPDTTLTFDEITADYDTLFATIDAEDAIAFSDFPTANTATYAGQFTGDLGIPETSTVGDVAGTVEMTLDFADPSDSLGSIGNLQSPTIDGIEGQIDFLVQNYSSANNDPDEPVIISGIYGGNLTVSDPDFAALSSGAANGLFLGGATGANADRLFLNLVQPDGTPTDYLLEGSLRAD